MWPFKRKPPPPDEPTTFVVTKIVKATGQWLVTVKIGGETRMVGIFNSGDLTEEAVLTALEERGIVSTPVDHPLLGVEVNIEATRIARALAQKPTAADQLRRVELLAESLARKMVPPALAQGAANATPSPTTRLR